MIFSHDVLLGCRRAGHGMIMLSLLDLGMITSATQPSASLNWCSETGIQSTHIDMPASSSWPNPSQAGQGWPGPFRWPAERSRKASVPNDHGREHATVPGIPTRSRVAAPGGFGIQPPREGRRNILQVTKLRHCKNGRQSAPRPSGASIPRRSSASMIGAADAWQPQFRRTDTGRAGARFTKPGDVVWCRPSTRAAAITANLILGI